MSCLCADSFQMLGRLAVGVFVAGASWTFGCWVIGRIFGGKPK